MYQLQQSAAIQELHRKGDPVMAVQSFTEEELQNLDKQTLIKLFLTTSLSSQQIIEQQTKQIELMNNNIKTLTAQLDVFKKYLFGRDRKSVV